jgi:hypothetical protein
MARRGNVLAQRSTRAGAHGMRRLSACDGDASSCAMRSANWARASARCAFAASRALSRPRGGRGERGLADQSARPLAIPGGACWRRTGNAEFPAHVVEGPGRLYQGRRQEASSQAKTQTPPARRPLLRATPARRQSQAGQDLMLTARKGCPNPLAGVPGEGVRVLPSLFVCVTTKGCGWNHRERTCPCLRRTSPPPRITLMR